MSRERHQEIDGGAVHRAERLARVAEPVAPVRAGAPGRALEHAADAVLPRHLDIGAEVALERRAPSLVLQQIERREVRQFDPFPVNQRGLETTIGQKCGFVELGQRGSITCHGSVLRSGARGRRNDMAHAGPTPPRPAAARETARMPAAGGAETAGLRRRCARPPRGWAGSCACARRRGRPCRSWPGSRVSLAAARRRRHDARRAPMPPAPARATELVSALVAQARARHPRHTPEIIELPAEARLKTRMSASELYRRPWGRRAVTSSAIGRDACKTPSWLTRSPRKR